MWRLRALALVLIALIALTPPVGAATLEGSAAGLSDAESDDLALAWLDDAIEVTPPPAILGLQGTVVAVVPIDGNRGDGPAVLGALLTRAPPRS